MSPASRAAIALSLMVGFYLLAIGIAVGLLWIAWVGVTSQSAGGIKVAFAAGFGGGSLLLSLRPRRDTFVPPGPRIERHTQPQLFDVLEHVSGASEQAMPREVYIAPDVNASVMTRGGILGIGGHRVMILGLPLLHVLTVDQLKAVLAHEFGHYGGGDTRVGRLVYHTRASIGRSLTAVEGRWMAVVLAWYGTFVMRVSMASARQQEFAADAFAARATSRDDMTDSLERLDRVGHHFPAYYGLSVVPTLQAGYRPPIGRGFASYCDLISQAPTVSEDTHEFNAKDLAYDSHPPTEARIAALAALGPHGSRGGDRRPASDLLAHAPALEAELYDYDSGHNRKLRPIEWSDVTERVMVPLWRDLVWKQRNALKNISIEALPASIVDVIKAGRQSSDPRTKFMADPEVFQRTVAAISAAVMLRLLDAGWAPAKAPSDGSTLVKDSESVQPTLRVYQVAFGVAPLADWSDFCRRAGVSGPLAAGS
jgi:heat shock protein HtpX